MILFIESFAKVKCFFVFFLDLHQSMWVIKWKEEHKKLFFSNQIWIIEVSDRVYIWK